MARQSYASKAFAAKALANQYAQDFEAFKAAWIDYPTQDNEGFLPDRGGFKTGWFAALRYERERIAKQKRPKRKGER